MPSLPPGSHLEVSQSEAQVISSLLGAGLESEEARIARSGLPRSTYQDVKRRVYARELVSDRYVPHPVAFGRPWATVILARPFAEDMQEWGNRWTKAAEAVVVWRGQQSIFGLFLHQDPRPGLEPIPGPSAEQESPPASVLTIDLRRPSLPVYFDFEGAWGSFVGAGALWNYPRTIAPLNGRTENLASREARETALALVRRTETVASADRPPHLLGPTSLPPSSRKLIARGLVGWRTFPRLGALQVSEGTRLDSIVLVAGNVKNGASVSDLFRTLVGRNRSFPFLLMSDGRQVVLGFLSARRPAGQFSRGNPGATLTEFLSKISVVREPVEHLEPLTDHRYAPLLEP